MSQLQYSLIAYPAQEPRKAPNQALQIPEEEHHQVETLDLDAEAYPASPGSLAEQRRSLQEVGTAGHREVEGMADHQEEEPVVH